jgi:large subunit ribosomal protein L4
MDNLEFAEVKTKNFVQMMNDCKFVQKTLFLVSENDNWANAFTSGRNIPNVKMLPVAEVNPIDLANADTVVLTEAAVKNLEEAYA